jgi:hypothetical protein
LRLALLEKDRDISRTIVDEDEEVVESSNGAHFHGTFDVHVDLLEEVGGLLPLGRYGLQSNFPRAQPVQRVFSETGSPITASRRTISEISLEPKCL